MFCKGEGFPVIKVLVVDDSSFMRKSLTHILQSDRSIEVVDTAADGKEAIWKVKQRSPDVVLLDIEMPVMDGLAALAHIMAECPTPVLMLSALNKRDAAVAIKALEYGAIDFIAKPSGVISYDIEKLTGEIISKVKAAADINVSKLASHPPQESYHQLSPKIAARKNMVVIGASTGGPKAIFSILSCLPRDIPAAVLVVQHMGPEFVPSFVARLQWGCSLKISTARRGGVIGSSHALVAPGGYHTLVIQDGDFRKIRLSRKTSPSVAVPSIDYAMDSAANAYGGSILGVLLTGMGSDGAKGLQAIKQAGGNTIVEDPSTCVVSGMPEAAIKLGCADEVVPLSQIAKTILKRI
ncbi:MAG: chemotaxis response regulator protein-glutamate methylesterase [Dehalococcoidia bacterium]|nr:chemotaxis response regulator protein-glutamate methylesterase [Dehalococcoidia bacterium]